MNQDRATKKKAMHASTQEYYMSSLKEAPMLSGLLGDGKQVSDLKSASDYSYHSSTYAFPYARIVGDSGCFIDPFFSSGVHLAVTGGLSAGTTIAASIRGDCDEATAAQWHSTKIREGYARFLLVVLSAYKQMRNQDEPVLADFNEDNFDRAFSFFKPSMFSIPLKFAAPLWVQRGLTSESTLFSHPRNGRRNQQALPSRILQDHRLLDQSFLASFQEPGQGNR